MENRPLTREERPRRPVAVMPQVVNAEAILVPARKVSPLTIEQKYEQKKERKGLVMIVAGGVIGLIFGIMANSAYLLGYYHPWYYCVIWATVVGLLVGLCLYPAYKKLVYVWPALAGLLLIPAVTGILQRIGVLAALTSLFMGLFTLVGYIIGGVIVIGIIWAWLNG